MDIGAPELLIILVIVILLFGVGRVGKIGGELGSAVGNFRKGLEEGSKKTADKVEEPPKEEIPQ
jgi:sec-independent protein translocase protein TatA